MNFYLCKVATLTRDSDGFVRFMTAADRPQIVDWTLAQAGDTSRTVHEQVDRYPDVMMERVYDVARPSIATPPTMALIRTEATLDANDYDWDMTNRNRAAWTQMYDAYAGIRAHPYTDAPFQPV